MNDIKVNNNNHHHHHNSDDNDNDDDDSSNRIKQASKAFFLVCNKYINDNGITFDELKECLSSLNSDNDISSYGLDRVSSWNKHSNPLLLFQLLDINNDNVITLSEYQYILDINYSDISNQETVLMQSRDGKIREVTRQEMFDIVNMNNKEQDDGITNDNNNIFKNIHKSGSIKDIAKDNPDVARFVAIGRWIQDELTKIDIYCNIVHMRSLPDGGSINNNEDKNNTITNFIENNDYNIWIEMTVEYTNDNNNNNNNNNNNKDNSNRKKRKKKKMRKFEFHIMKDRAKYIRPYLGIVHAWVLDSNNNRISNFTIPQLINNYSNNSVSSSTTMGYKSISVVSLISIIYFTILLFVVSFIRKLLRNNKQSNDNKKNN